MTPQPPPPGQILEITDYLDRLKAAGWEIVPGSLRLETVEGRMVGVVDVRRVEKRKDR